VAEEEVGNRLKKPRVVFAGAAFFNVGLYVFTVKYGAFAPFFHPIPILFFPVGIVLLLCGALSKKGHVANILALALSCGSR
jgi:hypothetical protein